MKHVDDLDLERLYLGMVTDPNELEAIDEHLLWCHRCLDRAEALQDYIDAMRAAMIRGNWDLDEWA